MRLRQLTAQMICTTAIVLPLLGAPFTVKITDLGLHLAPAQAWAGDDHDGDHGSSDDDHGSSDDDHGSSDDDHGSSDDDHSSSDDDHSSSDDDHGSSSDERHDRDQDRSDDEDRLHDQDRLEHERSSWLGEPERNQGGGHTEGGGGWVPVPEEQERQLIERGWVSDDTQGDDQ